MDSLGVGAEFGGYRLEAQIGRGGMGVVYRARELGLGRTVALKVVAPEAVDDRAAHERFVAEARVAASIEHPHVVPIYAAGDVDGVAYLVMRLIDGDDTRSLVRREGPLDPERAAAIAARAADGLDAIHAAGLVHRDVKPANLLLGPGDHVYLTDFGLARAALTQSGATRSGHWAGTLSYASPEQIRGERVDARADIYALGGVLCWLLTGKPPYDRDSDEAVLWAHLNEPPPQPSLTRPELEPAFDAVVGRAMAKARAERYAAAGEVGRAALLAAAGEAQTTPLLRSPPPVASTTSPGRRPSGRAQALAAGVLVAATAAAIVFLAPGGDHGSDQPSAHVPHVQTPVPSLSPATLTIRGFGPRPNGIALVGGEVWVSSVYRTVISRVDAASGRRLPSIAGVGHGVRSIAARGHTVWVANAYRNELTAYDARTRRLVRTVPTPAAPVLVTAGAGGVWAVVRSTSEPDTVLRYDASGQSLLASYPVPQGVSSIVTGGGALWVAEADARWILRVTDGRREWAQLREPPTDLTFGAGTLWATAASEDAVARVDPQVRHHTYETRGPQQPAQLAVLNGRLYVASYTDHVLAVLDDGSLKRAAPAIPVGKNPSVLKARGRYVWVASTADGTITRVRVH